MTSFVTSFEGLFGQQSDGGTAVTSIEIPKFQRDYAQGRHDPQASDVRSAFLDALHEALTDGEPLGLDFVYGEIDDNGVLRPLDGQQRLTTLFLLHWYLALRTSNLTQNHGWKGFSYATRPSARRFGKLLVSSSPPADVADLSQWIRKQPWYVCPKATRLTAHRFGKPRVSSFPPADFDDLSQWIRNQSWYQHVWRHDPTIQSMLVVIDAIHERFASDDVDNVKAAWNRLVKPETPAVWFHLLSISDIGAAEDLYIKMNSRGKPLTDFENFKARFEKTLEGCERAGDFAQNIDGTWTDVFFTYRDKNDLIDNQLVNYITFITQLCEWRNGDFRSSELRLADRAQWVYGTPALAQVGVEETKSSANNPAATENLDFLFDAFDTWIGVDIERELNMFFATSATPDKGTKVVIFGTDMKTDLFEACCHGLGTPRFGYPRMLLLYAILLHRIHHTNPNDFPRRLRILRNLIEASENELRADRMPELVADVRRIVVDGAVEKVARFNQGQVEDEKRKIAFLNAHPEDEQPKLKDVLFRLEDHHLLRGALGAFELGPATLGARTRAFWSVFKDAALLPALTGALLATGDYSRRRSSNMFQFGSPVLASWWRELLTGTAYADLATTRTVFGQFLDSVAASESGVTETLASIRTDWLNEQESGGHFDWRYYLVKYDAMRTGHSGIYGVPDGSMGFSVCMLRVQMMRSLYRDPYLFAVLSEAEAEDAVQGGTDGPLFTGPATEERWMHLKASNTGLRCVDEGIALKPPVGHHLATFEHACKSNPNVIMTNEGYLLKVSQVDHDGALVDTIDRVQEGAALLKGFVQAGL